MSAALPTPRRIFDVEGEAQTNPDGASRQEELARCVPGEPVELVREQVKGFGPKIVTVLSVRGVPIGRLTRQYAELLDPILGQGRPHRAKLHCLRGGIPRCPRYGARISIAWDGRREYPHRPLDEEQIRFRRRKFATVPGYRHKAPRLQKFAARAGQAVTASPDTGLAIALVAPLLVALFVYLVVKWIATHWCWACG